MSDDLISRQAAIDAVEKESQVDGAYGYMDTKSIVDLLEDLPSAEPQRKNGEWIDMNTLTTGYVPRYKCSICDEWANKSNYCPNCGARMERGEE